VTTRPAEGETARGPKKLFKTCQTSHCFKPVPVGAVQRVGFRWVSNTCSFFGGKFIPLSRPRHRVRFKFWPACLQRPVFMAAAALEARFRPRHQNEIKKRTRHWQRSPAADI